MSGHLRDEVYMIYCEGTNDKSKDETSGSQEKFMNRRSIILVEKLVIFRSANLRPRMLTGTEVEL